jgi:hypothetical protein
MPEHQYSAPPAAIVIGAGYMAAYCADDREMLADYRAAFTPEEMVDALTMIARVYLLGLACSLRRRPGEVADTFVSASQDHQRRVQR